VQTITKLHLFFSTPIVDPLPTLADMTLLASGKLRPRLPNWFIQQQGGGYRKQETV